jgi:acyl-CoA reductase-like NAD-dependent aldehyde dehydrogenase
MGPMNNRAQWNFVKELVARARDQGADIVELGEFLDAETAREGYYLRPALVRRAQPLSEIVAVEQFGPVLPVVAYQDEAQAVRMANDCELGLGSSIWSSSSARALAIARELEAGMTFINQTGASRIGQRHAPFGGVKQSGIGRESSDIGMAEYVEYHSIHCVGAPI